MAQQAGANVTMLLGIESTYNTPPSTAYGVPFNSSTLKGTQAINTPATITGNRNAVQPFRGNKSVEGTVVVPADSEAMWYWLQAAFGDPATTGSSSPYTHTFTVGSTQPSFAIEQQYTDLTTDRFYQYTGLKTKTWAMDIGGDGELVSTFGIVGATETAATSSCDADATSITISRIQNFHASLTEGGSAFATARSVNFTVDFGIDESNYVIGGSGVRGSIPDGIVSVTGSLTTLFDDAGYAVMAKGAAGTESSLVVTLNGGTANQLIIEFNELEYSQSAPEITGPEGLLVTLDFQAFYNNHGDASIVVATLLNPTAHA